MSCDLENLRAIIRDYGSALIAYSGGVDSAVVLAVATEQLGGKALGIIGKSPALPASEHSMALAAAAQARLPVRVIETEEHNDPNYLANAPDRCFHCRTHLFSQLIRLAGEEGFACVADGVHRDDLKDHIGGMKAARELGVRSPLLDARLDKNGVRAIARELSLPIWNKPAMACLASRVSPGTPITVNLLRRIEQAENALRDMGFEDFRVRHHGQLARLELTADDLPLALEKSSAIVEALSELGYRHVTIDLRPRLDRASSGLFSRSEK